MTGAREILLTKSDSRSTAEIRTGSARNYSILLCTCISFQTERIRGRWNKCLFMLQLTVEDYVHVMELLVNDVRFNMYNICYKRILVLWIFTAFVVLLGLLFSGVTGLTLFGLGVMWLVLNAAAIFFCMFIKIKLNHNLEKCMAQVNKHLLRHKILLGLDDRGKISCHKVNLCFIYFDTTDCIVSAI